MRRPEPADGISRFYAQALQDAALKRAGELREAGKTREAKAAEREAARYGREAELIDAILSARRERDRHARDGIALAKLGKMREARAAAAEAERLDRQIKKLETKRNQG